MKVFEKPKSITAPIFNLTLQEVMVGHQTCFSQQLLFPVRLYFGPFEIFWIYSGGQATF